MNAAATRKCVICRTDVPRGDWPTNPPTVCDKCARANQSANQTRPRPK